MSFQPETPHLPTRRARPKQCARRRKGPDFTNMGEAERERAVLELHSVVRAFEELEDHLRVEFADDPDGLDLRLKIKEDMQANDPLVQSQIWDIRYANERPWHDRPCSLLPCIWSALPRDLTEHVLSKLPMKQIIALTRSTSTSPCFRKSSAESHPDLFALMRWDSASVRATVYDPSCNNWTGFDLTGFPTHRGYEDSMYAHDRGLVCFVPASPAPVLVCNPLTGDWRTLPERLEHKPTLAVQLRVDETGAYTVKVVCGDTDVKKLRRFISHTPEISVYCYDSRTGRWTSLETGFVFGGCATLQQLQHKVLLVFDCEKRVLYHLSHTLGGQVPYYWAWTSRLIVVLHDAGQVTELAWLENSFSKGRTVTLGPYVYSFKAPPQVFLFATEKFLFVVGDSSVKVYGKSRQLLQVFDRETRKWLLTSDLGEEREASHPQCLKRAFVCELRWDAVP